MIESAAPRHFTWRPMALFALLAAVVIGFSAWLVASPHFARAPDLLALAVAVDLTLTMAAVYFFLGVRRAGAPRITLAPVILAGGVVAHVLLPDGHRGALELLAWGAGALELVVVAWGLWRFVGVSRAYRAERVADASPEEAFRHALKINGAPAWIAAVAGAELAILRGALLGFRDPIEEVDRRTRFSVHEESGWPGIALGLGLLVVFEGIALHVFLSAWSPVAAWVHGGLTVYSLLWLLGDYQAVRRGRIRLEEAALIVRIGSRWRFEVPYDAIVEVRRGQPAGVEPELRGGALVQREVEGYRAFTVSGGATVHLVLREPIEARGLFGIRRTARIVGLSPDGRDAFVKALRRRMAGD